MLLSTQVYLIHEGSWLMLLRNKKEHDINRNKWIAVGGRKEADETIEQCAVREVWEETGLTCSKLDYKGKVLFLYDHTEPEEITVYSCEEYTGEVHECDEGTLKWIPQNEILDLELWEGDRIFLKKMLSAEQKPFDLVLHYDENGNLKEVQERSRMNKPVIIGIAGGSASGKTMISQKLKDQFSDRKSVLIIRQDDYYKDQSDKAMEERIKTNYDHPFAFDNDLLVSHIKALINGEKIEKPTYDFVHHTRSDITETCYPCDVLILEGLFVLEDEEIRSLLDMKIFVDTDADVRFIRRLRRDVKERGRDLDGIIDQYMNTVRVMHNLFVEPSKRYADIVIPEGGKNYVAIDLLTTKISSIINH